MVDREKSGGFLAGLRKSRGWTQADLADRIHVSGETVSRWETGASMPDYDQLLVLCCLYDVQIEEILSGERLPTIDPVPFVPVSAPPAEPPAAPSVDAPTRFGKEKVSTSALIPALIVCSAILLLCFVLLLAGWQSAAETARTVEALAAVVAIPTVSPAAEEPMAESTAAPSDEEGRASVFAEAPTVSPAVQAPITEQEIATEHVPAAASSFSASAPAPVDTDVHKADNISTFALRHNGQHSFYATVTLPEGMNERHWTDDELLALKYASPSVLRERISTVADMFAWFIVTDPNIWDSNVNWAHNPGVYFYLKPDEQIKTGEFAADSIALSAAWLIEDDYDGLCVLYVNGTKCMNNMCVCLPIEGGWFVFDVAAFTRHGSFNGVVDCMTVLDFSDIYPLLDTFNSANLPDGMQLGRLARIDELDQRVAFYENDVEKHIAEQTVATPIPRKV